MRITSFPYHKNSAALFRCIAQRPYAIFLDSAHPHCSNTRFDIISAEPKFVLTNATLDNKDPFSQCKKMLTELRTELPNKIPELPFTIGTLGYFAYDSGRFLENMPTIAENDIHLPDFCVGFYDWSLVVDHHDQQSWLITSHDDQQQKINAWFNETPVYEDFHLVKNFQTNMPMPRYQQAFNQLKQHILDGNCYEANLCQRFTAPYQGAPWLAFETLRQKNPAPYSAYFNLGDSAILSFSPERFLSVDDHKAQTKPIKGTRPRSQNTLADQRNANALITSIKDQAENLMIVDLMRNDFGKCCVPGSIKVPKLFALESFHNVHHLVSTITGTLATDQHALDLLRHCFPGGSITGTPKISAMKIIEKLEPHRRSVYCGTLGYIDIRGNMDCNIAIRTMICNNNKIHCYAGGAIVHDSICDEEYQECFDKVKHLISFF